MNVLGLMLSIGAVTFSCAFPQMKGSCKSPPRFEHAELTGDSKKESFPMGQVVHYNCRPGYARLGAIRFICSEGKWLRLGIGECKKKSCGNPGEIDFGTFKLKNEEAFIFGAIVEYSCEPGYQMVSKYNSIECTATGWSRALPHCEAKLCPPVVDDSVRVLSTVYDDEYTAGHVINLECKNPNKKLNGPSQIHCTSDGTWNVDPPTCKDSCSIRYNEMEQYNLQVKNNQKLRVKHNELIEFECIPRYEISDPKNLIITCNDGVITYPACYLKAKLSPRVVDDSVRVLSNVYDEEYTAEHKGKKKSCPPPLEVQNGEWMGEKKQMYDSGSTIQFKCVSYYKRQGKEKIKCRNGIWDEPPYCLVPCILNSNYIKGNNTALVKAGEKYVEHGKPVKFRCLQTFGISDVKLLNVKCLNGTLKYPKCVKMEPCVLNDDYLKGNNTIVHASKMNFEHGESVKFKCLPTFNISDSKLLNGKCLDGKLKYPKCVKTGLCSLNEMTMLENNITVKSGNKHCGNQKVQNKCGIKENETIEFACLPDYETSEHEKLKVKCLNGVIEYPKCFKITTDEITVQPSVESEPNIY